MTQEEQRSSQEPSQPVYANPRPKYRKDRLRDDGQWQWKWYNDRMYELEEMMPFMEKKGINWLVIDKPKIIRGEVVYWFVGIRPPKTHHSVGSHTPMGWYNLGDIMEGKPYEDALIFTAERNKKEDAKNTKKYLATHPEKAKKKRAKKKS